MLKYDDCLIKSLDINKFKNRINCDYILEYLNKHKHKYKTFKNNEMFLNTLKKSEIEFFLNCKNNEIVLLEENENFNSIVKREYLLENIIFLDYLNDDISANEFKLTFSDYCFNEFKYVLVKIKECLIYDNFIEVMIKYPILENILDYNIFLKMFDDGLSNIEIENEYKSIITEILDSELKIDRIFLLNYNIFINFQYYSKKFDIDLFIKCEKDGYKLNDERKLLFETTKEKLFVIIKEKILTDSTLLDFSKSHIHLESDRKMLSFTSNFIFYGLYFKLFTKDELCFLEQNKLLLFVANDILNEQDFLLLLKENEIDFKNIYNVNMYNKDNYYPKEKLNLVVNLSTIPVIGTGLADFLLTYFDYLMNYNTVIFNNQGDINLSREQLLKPFLENIDILSKTFKLTEEEFLNILHTKLVVK
jgi:hypothetical protein